MAKKKKAKVRTLTEQQYNDYLMALKDERPTMVADENGKLRRRNDRSAFKAEGGRAFRAPEKNTK